METLMSQQPFNDPFFDKCQHYFEDLQARILQKLEQFEEDKYFEREEWERPELPPAEEVEADLEQPLLGGRGRTCVLEDGRVFERAGVNFSDVKGYFSESFAKTMPGESRAFRAAGVSLVIHPRNPFVPTVHMNVRRIQRGSKSWFGGGADLTPYYLDHNDARAFHLELKKACDAHPEVADYPDMKKQCDDYFYIPHREEHRGIGGIFFDYLDGDQEKTFEFVKDVGEAFLPAYIPIVEKQMGRDYSSKQREWQLYRRGRYVEFNLVYDRGTTFGLKTGGRIESILMSMPRRVEWKYNHQPEPHSPEAALLEGLEPRDWTAE
jgi:coproporphyrinogen III oxidase